MRILHTADWHLGRHLEGRSRLAEQREFIDELVQIVTEEQIDLVLMAGDVYDTYNPSAEAEELFYEALIRITDGGKRKIVCIAGNHDHPDRLSAATPLAVAHGITLIGRPNAATIHIAIPSTQEVAALYALPYPSESRLREVLSKENEEQLLQMAYDARISQLFALQESHFTSDTVRLAMSHLFIGGGAVSDSERDIQVGGAYTVAPQSLPAYVQYVALGHLHRPQQVKDAPTVARYAGSPLAYSFSETGYTKSVTIIDVKPDGVPLVHEIPLRSGKPLITWEAKEGLAQVETWLQEGRDPNAWINLEIHVDEPLSLEATQRLRRAHAGLIHVRPIYPEVAAERERIQVSKMSMEEVFIRFYEKQTNGLTPDASLVQLFVQFVQEEEERCAPSV